jgi:hypothetical protein
MASEGKMGGFINLAVIFSLMATKIGWVEQVAEWNFQEFFHFAELSTHLGPFLSHSNPGVNAEATSFNVD